LELLVALLGEGMSSRLFTEIREKRALAYAVQSSVTHYLDTGSIVIYAGVASKNLTTAVAAIIEELHRVKEDITEEELSRVKEFSKGRLLLRLEETRNLATYLGAQELLLNKIITIDELIAIVDAISIEEIERVARQNLVAENFHLAVVGPVAEEEASLKKLLSG
jgi:predicted Zn-dependent peptidase